MKCPFCAEEIQDEAILCRFCSATKVEGQWVAPNAAPVQAAKPPGTLTIQFAGALIVLSALYELVSITGAVPLFGAVHEGAVAVIYHLFYAALFGVMGYGLLRASPWAPKVVYAGTAVYVLEKLLYVVSRATRDADIAYQGRQYSGLMGMVDPAVVDAFAQLFAALFAASFLGFAAYIYYRRRNFEP